MRKKTLSVVIIAAVAIVAGWNYQQGKTDVKQTWPLPMWKRWHKVKVITRKKYGNAIIERIIQVITA